MATSPTNEPTQPPKIVNLDYDFLKQQGIAHVQELAGEIWTDYNEHDPGITILEELCHAIVDLEYRTNFSIQEILAPDPNHPEKDTGKNFYTSEEILPCNPLTLYDFIKIVADVPGVRNAKIQLSESPQAIKGGYHIFLDLEEHVLQRAQEEAVIETVKERLYAHRNLCEDFFEIQLLTPLPVRLNLAIESHSEISAEEGAMRLAQILYSVQTFMAPYIKFYSLRDMLLDKKVTVERIYTGPLLQQGFIDEEELAQNNTRTTIYVSEILERITVINRVDSVLKFSVALAEEESSVDKMAFEVPFNRIPKVDITQSTLTIYHQGSPVPVDINKVYQYFNEMATARLLERPYLTEEEIAMPEGSFRQLSDYYSIQHNFPLVYSVGKEGLHQSATKAHKAQVNQLKAYLLFFDQFLANYLAQLSHVKDLMAVNTQEHKTYFSQVPYDAPYLKRLIKAPVLNREKDEDSEFKVQRKYLGVSLGNHHNNRQDHTELLQGAYQYYLNRITENKEHHRVKKNKTLDHLLARFAEVFTDYSLLAYNTLREKALKATMYNKSLFLKDYIAISRDRNKGLHLTEELQDDWDSENISGFERRIYRLLGMRQLHRRFLHEGLKENFYVEQEFEHQSLEVFLGENLQSKYDNLFIFKGHFPQIRELAILNGIEETNYEVVEKPAGGYDIVLHVDKTNNKALQLMNRQVAIKSIEQATALIRQATKFFQAFNRESEGFHLVEHILLREDNTFQGTNDPYSFMMTMVFPSWPARFQKASFRNLVHETILAESPAHVLVNVLWLDWEEMEMFEKAYKQWITLRKTHETGDPQLSHAAKNLLGLIMLYVGGQG